MNALRERARTPGGQKAIRYSLVSVVSIVVNQLVLVLAFGLWHWSARPANILGCAVATVPSYYLNRTWAWGKSGRSHFMKEIVPFWVLAFIGLVLSTWAASFAESHSGELTNSRPTQTLIVAFASLAAFGVLWVAKFIIFNKILFAHREDELDPALDGRSGLPT